MGFKQVEYPIERAFDLGDFKALDDYAVNQYSLPIELMMENAGLQLANLVREVAGKNQVVKIGIGNGNNGGGGLVAARRLLAWGYSVYLDVYVDITRQLPKVQFQRALAFGAKHIEAQQFDVWIDSYLGFSQRLPLPESLIKRIRAANESDVLKLSLDIPTGLLGDSASTYFRANKVLTLAAPKKILYNLDNDTEIFIADIGIPTAVFAQFNSDPLPFDQGNILQLKR